MKKLLFLAFTAILGMSVNAQETLLSERPEGIVKVYDRAGKGIKNYNRETMALLK